MEIDFLVKQGRKICPVEVKSSAYRKHSSLNKFKDKYDKKLGNKYILYPKDVMGKDGVFPCGSGVLRHSIDAVYLVCQKTGFALRHFGECGFSACPVL